MVLIPMSQRGATTSLECRCTQYTYNSNGTYGYQSRLLINANGECEMMEDRSGGDRRRYRYTPV
jgi:hypothetical protein